VALQFDGTTTIVHGTTRNVAGGKIQPVAIQHWWLTFLQSLIIFWQKCCTTQTKN